MREKRTRKRGRQRESDETSFHLQPPKTSPKFEGTCGRKKLSNAPYGYRRGKLHWVRQELTLLDKSPSRQVVLSSWLDIVVLQYADRAIHLEHGQGNLFVGCKPMFAYRALQCVHADMLSGHVRRNHFA